MSSITININGETVSSSTEDEQGSGNADVLARLETLSNNLTQILNKMAEDFNQQVSILDDKVNTLQATVDAIQAKTAKAYTDLLDTNAQLKAEVDTLQAQAAAGGMVVDTTQLDAIIAKIDAIQQDLVTTNVDGSVSSTAPTPNPTPEPTPEPASTDTTASTDATSTDATVSTDEGTATPPSWQ